MEINMLGNLILLPKKQEKVFYIVKMVISILVIGKATILMEKVCMHLILVNFLKDH
jgi:hypothetical protein